MQLFTNPFRPGAGQPPPYLAGREQERDAFSQLLQQAPILQNLILTGLRGVGKTVLLETFRPLALEKGWFWAGNDFSEATGVSEQNLAVRILADLSPIVSSFTLTEVDKKVIGFKRMGERSEIKLTFPVLMSIYNTTPGLETDKLKNVLQIIWDTVKSKVNGIVLAYDEAQILKDKAVDKQYPLSLLLEVVQFLQRKQIPYLLILTGLPTLPTNVIEARTYSERMFKVMTLDKLNEAESRDAILRPIQIKSCPVTFNERGISELIKYSSGYPYFIQFFCKEVFDAILQQIKVGIKEPAVTVAENVRKLDSDFYFGRWSRVTDRQRELLMVIAKLPNANEEFTIKEIASKSVDLKNQFKTAYINNTLGKLIEFGLIFKNRRSKYSFAVPLLADYINRQEETFK